MIERVRNVIRDAENAKVVAKLNACLINVV